MCLPTLFADSYSSSSKRIEKKKKAARKSYGVIVASIIAFKLSIHAFFKSLRFIGLTYKLQLEKILFSCELYCYVSLSSMDYIQWGRSINSCNNIFQSYIIF